MNPLVSVTLVTHNSRKFLRRCLVALFHQTYRPLEIIVLDNASTDGTAELADAWDGAVKVIHNKENTGFAAGQNTAISASTGSWVLTLNPDVHLMPDFISTVVEAGGGDPGVGVVCGKLLRAMPDLTIPGARILDSTGVYFTPCLRHFDRGWNETDHGQYDRPEYVFGATAAAALYRREMIDDVALDDGFFDPDFFAYREDADVAWRAQLLGWRCRYVPEAEGYHVRRVLPERRKSTPAVLRMHSVKNRFLMRVKNITPGLYLRCLRSATVRDALVLGGCIFSEPSSLPAFWKAAQCLRRSLHKRSQIMRRRVVNDEDLAAWFQVDATSRPVRGAPAPARLPTTADSASLGLVGSRSASSQAS